MKYRKALSILPIILVFIGGIAGIYSAYVQNGEKVAADNLAKENQKKADDNEIKADTFNARFQRSQIELGKAQRELNLKQISLLSKSDSIINSNRKVIAAQSETIKQIVGNGFPEVFFNHRGPYEFGIYMQTKGPYPLYDVNVLIEDIDAIRKNCQMEKSEGIIYVDQECTFQHRTLHEPFTLTPASFGHGLNHVFKFKEGNNHFQIQVIARNMTTLRKVVVHIKDGKMDGLAYRVYKLNKKSRKIIFRDNQNLKLSNEYWEENFFDLKNDVYLFPFDKVNLKDKAKDIIK